MEYECSECQRMVPEGHIHDKMKDVEKMEPKIIKLEGSDGPIREVSVELQRQRAEVTEIFLRAFLAETGLKPSECELCSSFHFENGNMVQKIWAQKRKEE